MELSKKTIRIFLDLQEIVNAETAKIFQPIMTEVERQGQKVLLFPPVASTTWVEWLIKSTKGDIYSYPHYLFLVIQQADESDYLNLRLVARFGGIPNALEREVVKEHYRAGRKRSGWFGYTPEVLDEEDEWEEEPYDSVYSYEGLEELEWFSLKGEIEPEVIAARIVAEAQKIYRRITLNANGRRKERAKRRARARQRQALVPDTPNPSI